VPRPARRTCPSPRTCSTTRRRCSDGLDAKRFACWCDCGWGKTPLGLEWARHVVHRTGGRVLIVTLNEIVPQWRRRPASSTATPCPSVRLRTQDDDARVVPPRDGGHWIAVTNYEKWNPEGVARSRSCEAKYLAGVILDESSRLQDRRRQAEVGPDQELRGIEYKLS
jgi:hypothetical protein